VACSDVKVIGTAQHVERWSLPARTSAFLVVHQNLAALEVVDEVATAMMTAAGTAPTTGGTAPMTGGTGLTTGEGIVPTSAMMIAVIAVATGMMTAEAFGTMIGIAAAIGTSATMTGATIGGEESVLPKGRTRPGEQMVLRG